MLTVGWWLAAEACSLESRHGRCDILRGPHAFTGHATASMVYWCVVSRVSLGSRVSVRPCARVHTVWLCSHVRTTEWAGSSKVEASA